MESTKLSPGAPTLPPGLSERIYPEGGAGGGHQSKEIPNEDALRTHHCAACTAYAQCSTVLPYLRTAVLCTVVTTKQCTVSNPSTHRRALKHDRVPRPPTASRHQPVPRASGAVPPPRGRGGAERSVEKQGGRAECTAPPRTPYNCTAPHKCNVAEHRSHGNSQHNTQKNNQDTSCRVQAAKQ